MNRLGLIPVVVLLGLLSVGCSQDAEPAAAAPKSSEAPGPPLVLKPAKGKPIVMIQGLVKQPMGTDMTSFDALPQQTLTVEEPFLNESMTFTGVSFADLLSAAGAMGDSVTIHALDDYEATLDAAVLREPGVMLATAVEGHAIDVADGGPVRLVFPPSSETGKDTDMWVWSIDEITVE